MAVIPTSDTTETLTYLTSTKELYILELPFLEQKRKIKLKKDTYKISCFESCQNGRICLTGTEDGGIQIIADPACYWTEETRKRYQIVFNCMFEVIFID